MTSRKIKIIFSNNLIMKDMLLMDFQASHEIKPHTAILTQKKGWTKVGNNASPSTRFRTIPFSRLCLWTSWKYIFAIQLTLWTKNNSENLGFCSGLRLSDVFQRTVLTWKKRLNKHLKMLKRNKILKDIVDIWL